MTQFLKHEFFAPENVLILASPIVLIFLKSRGKSTAYDIFNNRLMVSETDQNCRLKKITQSLVILL